jgi:hypothetical protein
MVREDFSGPLLTCTDNDEPRYFQSGTICGANLGLRVQQGNVNDWLPWAWINGMGGRPAAEAWFRPRRRATVTGLTSFGELSPYRSPDCFGIVTPSGC